MQNHINECNIHHYIPQFYLRNFTASHNTSQKKRMKIFWKDKNGDHGCDLIADVCQMYKYNTVNQEDFFNKNRENILSKSLKSVIENSNSNDDIYNVKKLISYMYTDTPDYRQRIIDDAKKSIINQHNLYDVDSIDFIFDNSIKGKADITITAATSMMNTIENWQHEIMCFDNHLITSDSPVMIGNDDRIKDLSQMQIKPDVKNPNIIVENSVTKKRQVYIDNIVEITNVSFPDDTMLYTPLSPSTAFFLFSSEKAKSEFKHGMEMLSARNLDFYKQMNMNLYVYCNDYILGNQKELLEEASEYIIIEEHTRRFQTRERNEQRIRRYTTFDT